jgi:hypothetical protein
MQGRDATSNPLVRQARNVTWECGPIAQDSGFARTGIVSQIDLNAEFANEALRRKRSMPFEFLLSAILKAALWIDAELVASRTPPPPPLPVQVNNSKASADWFGFGRKLRLAFSGLAPSPLCDKPDELTASNNKRHNGNPQIQELLTEWEAQFKPQANGQVTFTKYVYDEVFRQEFRSTGILSWDQDRVCCQMKPSVVDSAKSNRKDSWGKPFEVRPGHPIAALLDHHTLTVVDHDSADYYRVHFPPGASRLHVAFLDAMAPFRLIHGAELGREFKLELGKQHSRKQAHLILKGSSQEWLRRFHSVEVLLRRPSYEPIAMRVFDVCGQETVYVYETSDPATAVTDSAFRVNVGHYKLIDEFRVDP